MKELYFRTAARNGEGAAARSAGCDASALRNESEKSVVRKNRTTRKAGAAKSTCKENLQVGGLPKSKRVSKSAMRAEFAKLSKKLKR